MNAHGSCDTRNSDSAPPQDASTVTTLRPRPPLPGPSIKRRPLVARYDPAMWLDLATEALRGAA